MRRDALARAPARFVVQRGELAQRRACPVVAPGQSGSSSSSVGTGAPSSLPADAALRSARSRGATSLERSRARAALERRLAARVERRDATAQLAPAGCVVAERARARVAQALEASAARAIAGVGKREQPRAQGQQVAGEVAAVDRRDVERRQRLERSRVVPVVEVARGGAPGSASCRARSRCARSAAPAVMIAEVVRRQVRQQREAHVGRRGAVRDDRDRMLLVVVRRQPVVLRADEGLEERPGLARESCAGTRSARRVSRASRRASGRLIHQAMAGEASHSSRTGAASASAAGSHTPASSAAATASTGAIHIDRSAQRVARASALARRSPFQQPAARDQHPPRRAQRSRRG